VYRYCISRRKKNLICWMSWIVSAPPAINGNWGAWGAWGTCSVTCGGGSQSRSRACDNPAPQNGGAFCSGNSAETQSCNTAACSESHFDAVFHLFWLTEHQSEKSIHFVNLIMSQSETSSLKLFQLNISQLKSMKYRSRPMRLTLSRVRRVTRWLMGWFRYSII
jgi:hypothetical protein